MKLKLIIKLVLLIFISLFDFNFLRKSRAYIQNEIYSSHQIWLSINGLRIKKNAKFVFDNIYIKKGGIHLILKNGLIGISLKKIIYEKLISRVITELSIDDVFIQIKKSSRHKSRQSNNFFNKAYFNGDKWESKYYPIFKRLIKFFEVQKYPNIKIETIKFAFSDVNKPFYFYLNKININYKSITGNIKVEIVNSFEVNIYFESTISQEGSSIIINNFNNEINYIQYKKQQILTFANYELNFKSKNETEYEVYLLTNNLHIDNNSISLKPVIVKCVEVGLFFTFTQDNFKICKNSFISFDGVSFSFEFQHSCIYESDLLKFSIVLLIDGDIFFSSYPFFVNNWMENIKATGFLILKIDFMISIKDPSYYYFNVEEIENSLQLSDVNKLDLSYLRSNLIYNFDNSKSAFPEIKNIDFIKVENLPIWLTEIIVICEDPNFLKHPGVDTYFIGVSIIKNILNKRFVKGASTITMQLARNLFLYHSKSISRKIDEIVLALIIENWAKISKERILEIYLNIIEYADGIYGIKSASKYYFSKEVKDLNLVESLVISYIIPRPKFFLDAFISKSEKLRLNLREHIQYNAKSLLNRGKISIQEYDAISYIIELRSEFGKFEL